MTKSPPAAANPPKSDVLEPTIAFCTALEINKINAKSITES